MTNHAHFLFRSGPRGLVGLMQRLLTGHAVSFNRRHQRRCFDKNKTTARKQYLAYVKAGIGMGRRPEMVGGGLVRSLGGWSEVKKLRLKEMSVF